MRWMDHLQQSPYCHNNYPILIAHDGRDACPCGWVGPKHEPVKPQGMTLSQIIAQQECTCEDNGPACRLCRRLADEAYQNEILYHGY